MNSSSDFFSRIEISSRICELYLAGIRVDEASRYHPRDTFASSHVSWFCLFASIFLRCDIFLRVYIPFGSVIFRISYLIVVSYKHISWIRRPSLYPFISGFSCVFYREDTVTLEHTRFIDFADDLNWRSLDLTRINLISIKLYIYTLAHFFITISSIEVFFILKIKKCVSSKKLMCHNIPIMFALLHTRKFKGAT